MSLPTISLTFYTIAFQKESGDFVYPCELTELGTPFNVLLDEFHNKIPSFKKDNMKESKFDIHFENRPESNSDYIYGRVYGGTSGEVAEYLSSDKSEHKYSRGFEDVEYKPYFFAIDCNEQEKSLILTCQFMSNRSIQQAYANQLYAFLRNKCQGIYKVRFEQLHLGSILFKEIILNGDIKGISVSHYKGKKQQTSKNPRTILMHSVACPTTRGKSKLAFNLNGVFKNRNKMLSSHDSDEDLKVLKKEVIDYIGMPIDADNIHELKLSFEHKGSLRTIDLGDFDKFATRYNISDKVEREKGSPFPKVESISQLAKEIITNQIRPGVKI